MSIHVIVHVYTLYMKYFSLLDSTGTAWLPAMKSVCAGSHDYHMTFIALETLLTLSAYDNCSPTTWPSCDVKTTCAVSALCPDVSTITKDTAFLEVHVHCTGMHSYTHIHVYMYM